MSLRVPTFTALLALAGCGASPQPTAAGTETQPEAREATGDVAAASRSTERSRLYAVNRSGFALSLNASGGPLDDPGNPFFQSLGTNGRSCHTCHEPDGDDPHS